MLDLECDRRASGASPKRMLVQSLTRLGDVACADCLHASLLHHYDTATERCLASHVAHVAEAVNVRLTVDK